jgi:uncharacterized iron-regulated membrane protein
MRKALIRLHGVVGLSIGAILVVIGISGSLLIFRDAIERSLNPDLWRVSDQGSALPLHVLISRLEETFPNDRIFALQMPKRRDEALVAWMQDEHGVRVHIDPYSGRVLRARYPKETMTGLLFLVHSSLLAGEVGESFNGMVALGLLGLVFTGAGLWWPRVKSLRAGIGIRGHTRSGMIYDIHKVVGMAAAIPLVVLSITGAGLVFYSSFQQFLTAVTGHRLREPVPHSRPQSIPRASLDLIMQAADAALPDAVTTWILFPLESTGVVTVRKRFSEEWHPNGRSFVRLDQYSGHVLSVENALQASLGRRLDNMLYPLHIGRSDSVTWRALYALSGLTPGILFVTGWVIWRRKRKGTG